MLGRIDQKQKSTPQEGTDENFGKSTNILTPCALKVNFQIYGRRMRTRFAPRKLARAIPTHGQMNQKQKSTPQEGALLFFGGSDENRTRVQRFIDITFSVGSQSIRFPTSGCRVTGFRQGSSLMRDRYKSNSRFTCTTDLTHGGGRSPPSRYGRHY